MSQLLAGETIAAVATPVVPQQGSVGIVRVSGAKALDIARQLFQAPGRQVWESHRILYGYVIDPATGDRVDEALLLIMRSPRSYTREDIVEFHCHGGIIPVQQVLQLCLKAGARLAQKGEFTLRAFLNGRLDLTQAQSVADLVAAQSVQASRMALAGLQGKLAHPIRQLRSTCLDILAEVEARIDFDEDLPPLDEHEVKQRLDSAAAQMEQLLATAQRGELLRQGLKIAIVGRPNVGKSSLLNTWVRSDRAIVTDLPGTTRDVVESHLVVGGIPVQVLDTAGIRDTEDRVEKIGIERSRKAAASADLILQVIDAIAGWTPEDEAIYRQVRHRPLIAVVNKIDRAPEIPPSLPSVPLVPTSAIRGEGIERLESEILTLVGAGNLTAADTEIAIDRRQADALSRGVTALARVQETIANGLPLDFWTIDLRSAIQALGEITGEEVTESMLERIFSRFCIGK